MTRRGLFANAGYKAVSLIMAGFVWFHVTEHQQFEQVVEVPLRIVNLPHHLAIVSGLPEAVKLRVRAQGRLISLRSKGITVPVDLSDARPGRVTRLLSPADVEVPEGVRADIVRVLSPGGLILECDSLVTREIRVVPVLHGLPASGFVQAREPGISPRDVRLRGPARYVTNITAVPTEPIEVEGARESVEVEAEIALRGARGLEASPSHVIVTIPVEKVESFELGSVPVIVQGGERARGLSWEPKAVKIEIRGARSRFESWNRSGIALTIDARELPAGYHEYIAEPGAGHLVKLVPLVDASTGASGDEIRALLGIPDFLEVASIAPRAFHVLVR